MPRKISMRKCMRCAHFGRGKYEMCSLQDLEPCMFKDIDPDRYAKGMCIAIMILIGIAFVSMGFLI